MEGFVLKYNYSLMLSLEVLVVPIFVNICVWWLHGSFQLANHLILCQHWRCLNYPVQSNIPILLPLIIHSIKLTFTNITFQHGCKSATLMKMNSDEPDPSNTSNLVQQNMDIFMECKELSLQQIKKSKKCKVWESPRNSGSKEAIFIVYRKISE